MFELIAVLHPLDTVPAAVNACTVLNGVNAVARAVKRVVAISKPVLTLFSASTRPLRKLAHFASESLIIAPIHSLVVSVGIGTVPALAAVVSFVSAGLQRITLEFISKALTMNVFFSSNV